MAHYIVSQGGSVSSNGQIFFLSADGKVLLFCLRDERKRPQPNPPVPLVLVRVHSL